MMCSDVAVRSTHVTKSFFDGSHLGRESRRVVAELTDERRDGIDPCRDVEQLDRKLGVRNIRD